MKNFLQPSLPYLLLPCDAIKASKDARLNSPSDLDIGTNQVREALEVLRDEFAVGAGTILDTKRMLPTPTSLDFLRSLNLSPDTVKSLEHRRRAETTVRKRFC